MDSLIETFHIDARLLLAQFINFGIVISVLYFFAIKPLTKTMQLRTKKIEESLENADRIEEKLAQTEERNKKVISYAKREANEIIEKAMTEAGKKKDDMLVRAKEEIGKVINEEKAKMQQEKAQVLKEMRSEVADLVVASMEKILEKKIDSKEDKERIKKIVKGK